MKRRSRRTGGCGSKSDRAANYHRLTDRLGGDGWCVIRADRASESEIQGNGSSRGDLVALSDRTETVDRDALSGAADSIEGDRAGANDPICDIVIENKGGQ